MSRQPLPAPAGHPRPRVVPADTTDLDILSHLIAEAFHDLAPSQWLITDPAARRQIFPGYFAIYVEHALAAGLVHTTPGRDAAALWLPGGPHDPGPPAGYDARLAAATGPWAGRFAAFDAALAARHPADVPHHHLALLAVRPSRQGRGIGTALLDAYHWRLDCVGVAAYLEASDLRTRALYLRHGYTDTPGPPINLPGGPPLYPMLRQHHPRPGRAGPARQPLPGSGSGGRAEAGRSPR